MLRFETEKLCGKDKNMFIRNCCKFSAKKKVTIEEANEKQTGFALVWFTGI